LDEKISMKSLKVLMIAPTSFFADYGGHVRMLEEAVALQKLGHRVIICTYHNGQDVQGLDIQRTLTIPWRQDFEVGSSRHKIALDALLFLKSLSVALRWKPDIVHGHIHEGALIGYPISRLLRVPLVFDLQGGMTSEMIDHGFLEPSGLFCRSLRWLEGIIDHVPQAIITSTQHAKDLLCGEFGCDDRQIHIIPDSVNGQFFQPSHSPEDREQLKPGLGIPGGDKVVVYLGLLAEWQGIGLLLDGIAQLRGRLQDTRFLIMGFPNVEYYRTRARQLGIEDRVVFTGKIPYLEAPSYLALGDVAVSPKVSTTEGCGKLLNYMAMGLPTVSFDTPVSREYLGQWGAYAPKGDSIAFARAIVSLLNDKQRALELGSALRTRALRHYSWEKAGSRLEEIYRCAVALLGAQQVRRARLSESQLLSGEPL
jgi:glycosyltransferase involved in cell wall biosynthesis